MSDHESDHEQVADDNANASDADTEANPDEAAGGDGGSGGGEGIIPPNVRRVNWTQPTEADLILATNQAKKSRAINKFFNADNEEIPQADVNRIICAMFQEG